MAASLWRVDQRLAALGEERAALDGERAALLAELAAGPASPAPGPASPVPGAGTPAPPEGADQRSVDDGRAGHGPQRLLLVTGVVLVTASALGLGALAVTRLGALGQLGVLVVLVTASLLASWWSQRQRLGASAESFAVLAVALTVTGAGAVRSQGIVGPQTVPDRAWPLVVLAALCLLSALAGATLRRQGRPMAFGWAALSTGALVPGALALLVGGGQVGLAAVLLGAALVLPVAAPLLAGHGPAARLGVLLVAAVHLGLGVVVALASLLEPPARADALLAALVLAVLALGAVAWAAPASARWPAARAALPVEIARAATPTAWVAAGAAVLAAASAGGAQVLVVVGAVLAAASAALLITGATRVPWAALVTAQAVAVACLLLVPSRRALEVVGTSSPPSGSWAAWALVAAAAAATALVRPRPGPVAAPSRTAPSWTVPSRSASSPAAPATAGGASAVWAALAAAAAVAAALSVPATWSAAVVGGDDPRVPALAVVATVALVLAAPVAVEHRARPARPARSDVAAVLVTAWAAASALAVVLALDAGGSDLGEVVPSPARSVLALAGVQALVLGARPRWHRVRAGGVALLSVAWWATAGDVLPAGAPVEAWTLPPALLALVVGALAWRRHPSLSSWAVLGPALLIALAPSTVVAVTVDAPGGTGVTGSVVRPVALVLVSLVLVRLGAQQSWQAPLVLGASAAILAPLVQLGPFLAQVPLWVATGLSGVVVLVTAVRLEAARRSSARALTWFSALR